MSPQIMVNEGRKARIRVGNEKFLPKEWVSPVVNESEGEIVFTPSLPVFDEPTLFGFEMELTVTKTRSLNSDKWVHIQGIFLNREEEVYKMIEPEKTEVLNNFGTSYTADHSHFSMFVKNNSTKNWSFVSGKNEYDLKFYVKQMF